MVTNLHKTKQSLTHEEYINFEERNSKHITELIISIYLAMYLPNSTYNFGRTFSCHAPLLVLNRNKCNITINVIGTVLSNPFMINPILCIATSGYILLLNPYLKFIQSIEMNYCIVLVPSIPLFSKH